VSKNTQPSFSENDVVWVGEPFKACAAGAYCERDERMPKPGDAIHIPLKTNDALRLLMKVKPTDDMPRPGANPTGKPKKRASKKRSK